ncbi:MAG: hypothetical protein L7F78_20560, partial [Syntrophales bacterium LBB04]|nr:hypothetical protein [Syntrophales bacterium LBB04]
HIMVYEYEINGLTVRTGDLICTQDGDKGSILGKFWWLIGKLIPGDVDHIAIYVGPEGRCVEAGAKGKVITFDIKGRLWDANSMVDARGPLIDTFYGVAYPLEKEGLSVDENKIRERVAAYCLEQAQSAKPYNLNFLNSATEDAFYCSQLAYKAYLAEGIDFNSGKGISLIPGTGSIIFPQEIWDGCVHRQG